MAGVVVTHAVIATQPPESTGANAVLMVLHTNRELFFFVSAFVLALSTRFWERSISVWPFWRRRFPPVLLPYVLWNVVYWITDLLRFRPPADLAFQWIVGDLVHGWSDLYFLLVTMQLYIVFPILAWLVMRTHGHHGWLFGISLAVNTAITGMLQYFWPLFPEWVQSYIFGNAQVEFWNYQFFFVLGALCACHFNDLRAWVLEHRGVVLWATLAAALVGEAWFVVDLMLLDQSSSQAANVLQPAEVLFILAATAGLWILAEWAVVRFPVEGRFWRATGFGADASFGVFLFHMTVIIALTDTPIWSGVGFDRLPATVATVVLIAITLAVTLPCVALLRRLPFSSLTTGRPRRPFRAERRARAA